MSSNQVKTRGRPPGSKNKPKVLNIGQQPNPPQIQQQFAGALNAKNMGVDKVILNINGGNSDLVTNKNAILKYSLKQPIQLEVGDVITCVNAFVEEKGLQTNTISFEEDIEAEMRFCYYKQGDPGDETSDMKDIGFAAYPKFFPDMFNDTRSEGTGNPGDPKIERAELVKNYLNGPNTYENLAGDCTPNMNFGGVVYNADDVSKVAESRADVMSGPNGNYYYLCETVEYDKVLNTSIREFVGPEVKYLRPVYGSKTIKVKAGNYSVDSLANIISAQLNGSLGPDNNEFTDALLDKLYNANGVNKDKFFQTYPYFKDIDNVIDPSQSDLIGNCGEKAGYERRVDGFVKEINYSVTSYYENWAYQNIWVIPESFSDVQPTQRLGNQTFPNGQTAFAATPGMTLEGTGDEKEKPASVESLLTTQDNYGNGKKNVHFYMNKKAIEVLFETEDRWYNLPGLETNTANGDGFFVPPNIYEMMYATVDLEHGFIPRSTTNAFGSLGPENPYDQEVRYADIDRMMAYQMIYPVKGLKYPGRGGLEPLRQKFAGTSVAQLTFGDAVSNRFALSNFHEFYKLPNLDAAATAPSGFGGQQATKLNNPFFNDSAGSSISDNISVATDGAVGPTYPIDSSSGVAINNFDFALVKDTPIYKNLISQIQAINGGTAELQQLLHKERLIFELFTKPFDQFFDKEVEAQAAWSKSLWARLGFTYNQLGNISKNLESFQGVGSQFRTTPQKQTGIITHNGFDFSKIVSSDGLGTGNPISNNGTPMQNYRLTSYFTGDALPGSLGISGNIIHLLSDSKPINAENLPSLNDGKSYLLIESDLVKPNFKDNKSNWGNLLAIMSKENATNDTIFGADPIDFIVTEPRLLSDITIYIKNPDGTLAADDVVGQNNGFIIQIAKAIPVQKLPSIEI